MWVLYKTRIVRKLKSTVIAISIYFMLPEVIGFMSDAADTIREIIANPKTMGGAAGTGWIATLWESINSAAPDLLLFLSIFATCLTIWAFFSNRKRQKARDAYEKEVRDREEERKEELHQKQIKILEEAAAKEKAKRVESERKHELMEEISVLSKKDIDPVALGEMMGKVTKFEPKKREA